MIEAIAANDASDDESSVAQSINEQDLDHDGHDDVELIGNADNVNGKKKSNRKTKSSDIAKNVNPSQKKDKRLCRKKPQFTPKQRMDMYAFCVLELELQNERIRTKKQQIASIQQEYKEYKEKHANVHSNKPTTYGSLAPQSHVDNSANQKKIIIHPPQQQTVVVVHGPPPQSQEQLQQLLQQPQMQQILQPPLYQSQAHFQLQFAQPPTPSYPAMIKAPNQVPEVKLSTQRQTRRTKQGNQVMHVSLPPSSTMSTTTTNIISFQSGPLPNNQPISNAQGTLNLGQNQTKFVINQGPTSGSSNQPTSANSNNTVSSSIHQQNPTLSLQSTTNNFNYDQNKDGQNNAVVPVQKGDLLDQSFEDNLQPGSTDKTPKRHECFSDYQNTQILSNHILKEVQRRFAYFYPSSPTPSRTTIKHVWDNCITLGTVQNKKKERKKTNQPMAEVIEYLLVHEPQLSLRQLAKKLNVSTGTVSKRCKELGLVPESVTLKHHQMALAKRQKQLKQLELMNKTYEEENEDTNHRVNNS